MLRRMQRSVAAAVLVEAFNEIIDELDRRTIADRERAEDRHRECRDKSTLDDAQARDEAVDRDSGRNRRRGMAPMSTSL